MKQDTFRMSLCASPYIAYQWKDGKKVIYQDGERSAENLEELQKLFMACGGNEMWVRINTQRKRRAEEDQIVAALECSYPYLELAKKLDIPVNPELMCCHDYMDFSKQDAPGFEDYPECSPGKPWSECSLDEMCTALEKYGEAEAKEILSFGVRVNVWDIGNETNYGFAGVNVGLPNLVSPEAAKRPMWRVYASPNMGANWLRKHVWPYNARQFAAVARGIKKVDPNAKFSVHISTAAVTKAFPTLYYKTLMENGFTPDQAGISFYPSTPGPWKERFKQYQSFLDGISGKLGLPLFLAEYAYPSASVMTGEFASWVNEAKGYPLSEDGQEKMMRDVIAWGRENGLCGIRPFAPDLLGYWQPMSLFNYDEETHTATPKKALLTIKEMSK